MTEAMQRTLTHILKYGIAVLGSAGMTLAIATMRDRVALEGRITDNSAHLSDHDRRLEVMEKQIAIGASERQALMELIHKEQREAAQDRAEIKSRLSLIEFRLRMQQPRSEAPPAGEPATRPLHPNAENAPAVPKH